MPTLARCCSSKTVREASVGSSAKTWTLGELAGAHAVKTLQRGVITDYLPLQANPIWKISA
jgi:hypothetical protein